MKLHGNSVLTEQETSLFAGMMVTLIPPAEELSALQYKGGKIDKLTWEQVKSFLLHSQKEYKGEAQVRLFYHKRSRIWAVRPLEQYISSSLETEEVRDSNLSNEILEEIMGLGYMPFGTVHHHCTAGAFQSGTDHADEKNQNGLHITLGHMESEVLDFHSRHTLQGIIYPVNLGDWFEEGYEEWLTTPVETNLFPEDWKKVFKERPKPAPIVWNTHRTKYVNYAGRTIPGYDTEADMWATHYDDEWEKEQAKFFGEEPTENRYNAPVLTHAEWVNIIETRMPKLSRDYYLKEFDATGLSDMLALWLKSGEEESVFDAITSRNTIYDTLSYIESVSDTFSSAYGKLGKDEFQELLSDLITASVSTHLVYSRIEEQLGWITADEARNSVNSLVAEIVDAEYRPEEGSNVKDIYVWSNIYGKKVANLFNKVDLSAILGTKKEEVDGK